MSLKMSVFRNLSRNPTPALLGRDGTIQFTCNGIATDPVLVDRGPGQAFGWFIVPPGCYAVITGPQDQMRVYRPGVHLLDNVPAGDVMLQLVKASPQLVTVNNISGQSQDAWSLSLDIEAKVVVNERGARSIVGQDNPLTEMRSLIAACALEVAETLTLAAFLGQEEHPLNCRQPLATAILNRVHSVPGVDGLMLIRLAVTNRRGDQQQINLNREATVTRLSLETKRQIAELEHQHQVDHLKEQQIIAECEREINLYRAETTRLEKVTAQQTCLDKAEIEAQAKKLYWESAQPEHDWELKREETFKKLDAVVEAFNALAKAYEGELKIDALRWPGVGPVSYPVGLNGDGQAASVTREPLQGLAQQFAEMLSPFHRPENSNGHAHSDGQKDKA